MAKAQSFDITSEVDLQEVDNAVNQASKEIAQRYDFKGSRCAVDLKDGAVVVLADDEYKLKSVMDILQSKVHRRGISLKSLDPGKVEAA